MYRNKFITIGLLFASTAVFAAPPVDNFNFLDSIDVQPHAWRAERPDDPNEPADPIEVDLLPFYRDFAEDGHVSIYLGYGIGTYYPERAAQVIKMLQKLAEHYELPLRDWNLRSNGRGHTISFLDSARGLRYTVTVGYERNEFIDAFSDYEVVMYHGHSRYGIGPAFQSYQNYFRMGSSFDAIEVDTRNYYFRDEPVLKTEQFPLRYESFGTQWLPYQYRGSRSHGSKLPKTSFTKNIPGKDTDLARTRFLDGRQIIYLYSCTNRKHWKDSLRSLHPERGRKAIFGTYRNGHGATQPDALMILSIVKQLQRGSEVLDVLNSTKDCKQCFTTY